MKNSHICSGCFMGGEIEPGTFHGGEIEPGTFHHTIPSFLLEELGSDSNFSIDEENAGEEQKDVMDYS